MSSSTKKDRKIWKIWKNSNFQPVFFFPTFLDTFIFLMQILINFLFFGKKWAKYSIWQIWKKIKKYTPGSNTHS